MAFARTIPVSGQSFEEALAGLRETLVTAAKLTEPWRQFQDAVDRFPEFMDLAEFKRSEAIEKFLVHAGERVLNLKGALQNVALMEVAGHRFWHGGARLGSWVVACFFFEELGMGLAGYVDPAKGSGIELIRMTMAAAPAEAAPGRKSFVSWSRRMSRAKA